MNKRYIVTKASDDKTFLVGDHIIFYDNGDVGCIEAQGWIDSCDAKDTLKGAEYVPDQEYYEKKRKRLEEELAALS